MSNRNPRPGASAGASLSGSGGLGWQESAACRGEDPETFFAPDVSLDDANLAELAAAVAERKRREVRAKAICSGCMVRTACLEFRLADEHQLDGGIWAGLNEQERWRLRKNRIRTAKRRAA